MKKIGVIGLSMVIASSMVVMAEQGAAPKAHAKGNAFAKADADGDGKLSLAEFETMVTKGDAEAKFTAADTDKDGYLTKAELKGHGNKHKKAAAAPVVRVAPVPPVAPVAPVAPVVPAAK
jgi:hypothetical protein